MPTWSTNGIPRQRQFKYWREIICEAFMDLTPESDQRDGFLGQVDQRQFGRLDLARIRSQAQKVSRTEADIARSPQPGYYANLQVRGVCRTTQDGRTTVLHPGDLTVLDTYRPFAFEFTDEFQQLSLHIPGALLDEQLDRPLRTATRISTVSGVGAAVRHALATLVESELEPNTAAKLAAHTCGLLAVAVQHQSGSPATHAVRHRRLLDAALADIEEHLPDEDLCPAVTAGRLGISVRVLHQLFAGHEHTFATAVRRRRLEHAHRDLADPARAALRVIDIAADAGFADVTHFHRVFRETYGCTPTQLRRSAGQPGWSTAAAASRIV